MNIRQRLSLATSSIAGLTGAVVENKGELDEQMKMLYISPSEIDKKCAESAAAYVSSLPRKSLSMPGKDGSLASTDVNGKEDLSTSYEKSPESVVEGLPKEYFTPDYDPIAPHLEEISTWEESEMIEKFMTKIEEADTDKDVIIGHLTTMIDANYNDLVECMRNVQSIDVDLCKAGIQIGHGRQRIRSACDIIHSGAIKVRALHSKRGKISKMAETIRSLQALKGVHQSMMTSIKVGELSKAAGLAQRLLECLQSDTYAGFKALKSIGASTEKSVVVIRQKCDKALKRLCGRKFSAAEYENVLTAYVLLDQLCEDMGVAMYDATDKLGSVDSAGASFYFDSVGCIEGLSQRIKRFQLEDVEHCLHTALTEYCDATQLVHASRDGADPLDAVGSYLQQQRQDSGEGSGEAGMDVPLNLLYRHLTADVIAPCVVRTCELLADVAHTHFLLTQWHRCPFDPQNHDSDFLHRRPLPVKATAADMLVLNVQTNRTSLSSNSSATTPNRPSDRTNRDSFGSNRGLGSSGISAENHSEIIDLGREFHDEESDGEDNDHEDAAGEGGLQHGDAALAALTSSYRKISQQVVLQSTLSEELTASIAASFNTHFPRTLLGADSSKVLQELSAEGAQGVPNSGVRLAMVLDGLQQSRALLWEEMMRALLNMLGMLTFTSEVKIEDFLAMAWALNNMVELGKEFCGSQSRQLIATLEEKSREYFHNFHCESFQMIRDMVEAESWQSVPIDMELSGGILGIIKTTLLRDAARAGKICFSSASTVGGSADRTADGPTTPTTAAAAGAEHSQGGTPATSTDNTEATQQPPVSPSAAISAGPTILMRFGTEGNPFHFQTNSGGTVDNVTLNSPVKGRGVSGPGSSSSVAAAGAGGGEIERKELRAFWQLLQAGATDTPAKSKRAAEQAAFTVVTQTALNGVAKYVAKYLHLMYLLPASSQGIFENLTQLFDYYLCAVFNGFMPFEERQKFMAERTKSNAPPPNCSMEFELLKEYLERALDMLVDTTTTDAAFDSDGGGLRPSSGPDAAELAAVNGETSPMGNSSSGAGNLGTSSAATPAGALAGVPALTPAVSALHLEGTKMSLLLRPPGIPLNIESTCMALNERIVAAESCCFISMILQELKGKIAKLVPESFVPTVESFVSQYQRVAGQLRALIYRALCPQLIKYNTILAQITDCSWDSKKMRTEVHDWVPRLADNCRAVWEYMMLTEQFAESSPLLREQVWLEICQAAFDVCLDGYAKVRKVSVEGRSAMTTDTIALHDALNTIHLCRPPRGKHYIDNYLRSALLSEEELLAWVRENWESYAYRHIAGLLTQTLFSLLNSKKLKDATAMIDALYELKDGESTSTLGLLSQSADATFSRAFNSTFRRQSLMMS